MFLGYRVWRLLEAVGVERAVFPIPVGDDVAAGCDMAYIHRLDGPEKGLHHLTALRPYVDTLIRPRATSYQTKT